MKVACYARVSTHDQQTLPLQLKAMEEYAKRREWTITERISEIGSGKDDKPPQAGRAFKKSLSPGGRRDSRLETGPLGPVPGRPCFHAEELDRLESWVHFINGSN